MPRIAPATIKPSFDIAPLSTLCRVLDGRNADQVKRRVEENPHHVDEMPVHRGGFDGPVALGVVQTFAGVAVHDDHENHPGQHVKGVKPGHGVKQRPGDAGAGPIGGDPPLHAQDPEQKGDPQGDRDQERTLEGFAIAVLHGDLAAVGKKAADEQDQRDR